MSRQVLTRITLILPAPLTYSQHYLVDNVIDSLARFCDGATASQDFPSVVNGRWFNEDLGYMQEEPNLLILADAEEQIDDSTLTTFLDNLKFLAQIDFNQTLIWITLHEVQRVTTDDP